MKLRTTHYLIPIVFSFAAMFCIKGYTSRTLAASSNPLKVTLRAQELDRWCWAANGQMIMEYLGQTVGQCDQANKRFGRGDCCPTRDASEPDGCNRSGWPEFNKYGFTYSETHNSALNWDQLRTEIDQGRPFAFSWQGDGGPGHMMVAIGYQAIPSGQYVIINDPWPPKVGDQRAISFELYANGRFGHYNDFYKIHR
jgi:hypothetical protein